MLPLKNYIQKPSLAFLGIIEKLWFLFPDKLYLNLQYRLRMGQKLNLKHPESFSEKLQWLKLYNRKPEYTQMVDKYAVKKYVAEIIGEEHIIPTIGVWERPEDVDWESLPNQFVLKTTHGGGNTGVVICPNKSEFDKQKAIERLNASLKQDIYKTLREWPYKDVPNRIIAEKYMEDDNHADLLDYKFFCFNGLPQFCQVITSRSTQMTVDFFDMDWNHQPFHEPSNSIFSSTQLVKPTQFDEMQQFARLLSQGQPFLRVDFYEINAQVYFGELTFFPTSGFGGFSPTQYDKTFGNMIELNL